MQKLGTMEWLKEKLRKTTGKAKSDYSNVYFRYENIHKIKHKFNSGGILSGLTTKCDDGSTGD